MAALPPLELELDCPNQSERSTQDVRLVVVHDPEGSYAAVRRYLMSERAQVSYHVLLRADGRHAIQFVRWSRKAWSCRRFNSRSDNVCIEGYAAKGFPLAGLRVLARIVACRLHARRLPARFVSAPVDPDEPPRGFTFHSELGVAGGNHSDPGLKGARKAAFIGLVKWERRRGDFPARWGRD